MAAIPQLQNPVTISLGLRDIVACFRACLWDEERQQMVSYREAKQHADAERADALQLTKWENEGGATGSSARTSGINAAAPAGPPRVSCREALP